MNQQQQQQEVSSVQDIYNRTVAAWKNPSWESLIKWEQTPCFRDLLSMKNARPIQSNVISNCSLLIICPSRAKAEDVHHG
jgi:hypothetical protein